MNNYFRNFIIAVSLCIGFAPLKIVTDFHFYEAVLDAAELLALHGASSLLDRQFQLHLNKDRVSCVLSVRNKRFEVGMNFWVSTATFFLCMSNPRRLQSYKREVAVGHFLLYPLALKGIDYIKSHYKIVRKDSNEMSD